MGVAHLLALGGPPLLCFQNLLALFVIRLGQGLGLSGDTLRYSISVPLSYAGLDLYLGVRTGFRGRRLLSLH